MSNQSKYTKAWRKRTKARIVEAMGEGCCICGYNRCSNALALHHVDPRKKEFSIGQIMGHIVSWARIVVELRKCALLCHNCHEEVHAGLAVIPEGAPRFNEKYATYKEAVPKRKCKTCDNTIARKNKSGLCDKCYKKSIRQVERPSKKTLVEEIEAVGYKATGRKYGVTDNTIRKWLKTTD